LARARALGAHTVDFTRDDPLEAVRSLGEGRGADVVLELVGSPEAMRSAYRLVRPGGVISVVGVHNEDHLAFSPAEAYDKNLTFTVGRCPARHMMEALLPLVREGRYDLASVISHRLPLERGAEGYAMFDEKRDGCTKVLLLPGAPC
jgi:threonine dehydrogenase-like Zn-dependent dehydrogenase